MARVLVILFVHCITTNAVNINTPEILRRRIENLRANLPIKENIYCPLSLAKFYENNSFQLIWSENLSKQFLKEIKKSHKDGLHPNDYHLKELNDLISHFSSLNPEEKVSLELLATDAFLLFITHLQSGKVNSKTFNDIPKALKEERNPVLLLSQFTYHKHIEQTLKEVRPNHSVYIGLQNALDEYKNLKNSGGWEKINSTQTLKKGMYDDDIRKVKHRLLKTGELSSADTGDVYSFDEKLENAVKIFQYRHGLENDGIIGKKTLTAMNVNAEERVNQIEANLERWRWLPQNKENYYLRVNIADFTLDVIQDNIIERQHKVIVGKPYRKTPVFIAEMTYLVFNPSWTIPPTILREDIIPAAKQDSNYLKRKNIFIYDLNNNLIAESNINWSSSEVNNLFFRQDPGKNNALGLVKFMFPNPYNVYIHDTPATQLFDRQERTFSSGCIRVQNALELAEYLLKSNKKWNRKKIQEIISSGEITTVPLQEKPKVYLLYRTAWMDKDKLVHFRNDIYERDKPLINALKKND